ncbi:MAG: DUF1552 domain-containing protein [Deltaproteobacteria bacterium]|nr:DUF1552 domain-containing protein [Deltaproteobacteria bacterium]
MSKRLSRRHILGGAAAAISLPFLEAMLPRGSRAYADQGSGIPRRMLFYFLPNGLHMPAWWPEAAGEGDAWSLSPMLEPLADMKEQLVVLRGLANRPAIVPVAGDHARGTGSFLTCRTVNKSEGDAIYNGISVDQVIAPYLCGGALFPSMQLGIDGGGTVGACDSGYSCAYIRNISWAGPTTPLAKLVNPQIIFDRMFAGFDPSLTAEGRERRRMYRSSILDLGLSDGLALRSSLGVRDRLKLDEYLNGVRELELRIQTSNDELACAAPDRPDEDPTYVERVALLTELIAVALECDMSRVVSFMLGNGSSYRSFSFLGVGGAHHELSHHQDDPVKQQMLQTIGTWEMEQFGNLIRRLSQTEEVDGSSLLDHCAVMLSSEIADGNAHQHVDLPMLVAGGFGGQWETNRFVDLGAERPLADFYLGLIQAAGGTETTFGDDSTGTTVEL